MFNFDPLCFSVERVAILKNVNPRQCITLQPGRNVGCFNQRHAISNELIEVRPHLRIGQPAPACALVNPYRLGARGNLESMFC
jgi:hypothetical protein